MFQFLFSMSKTFPWAALQCLMHLPIHSHTSCDFFALVCLMQVFVHSARPQPHNCTQQRISTKLKTCSVPMHMGFVCVSLGLLHSQHALIAAHKWCNMGKRKHCSVWVSSAKSHTPKTPLCYDTRKRFACHASVIVFVMWRNGDCRMHSCFGCRWLLFALFLFWSSCRGVVLVVSAWTWRHAASQADIAACLALRHTVFVQEQGVPMAVEMDGKDDNDDTILHIMCWDDDDNDTLVATGRVVWDSVVASKYDDDEESTNDDNVNLNATTKVSTECLHRPDTAILGRIAVHKDYRRQGLGRQVIKRLEEAARQAGAARCTLTPHAYLHDFYARLGYTLVPGTTCIPLQNSNVTLVHMEKWLQ